MVYIHRRHRTYTVGILGVRDGAAKPSVRCFTPWHGASTPWDGLRSGSVATGCALSRLVTLPMVSVRYVRFLYTVWRHKTLTHAMLRYVTLPHAVYDVCTPSRCVCIQFCGVRHSNVSICQLRMKRMWIGVFFILSCWPSPSSICSVALLFLNHCRQMQLRAWQLKLAEHWRITIVKLGRKEADIKTKFPISYFLRAWKREGKARKRSHKKQI